MKAQHTPGPWKVFWNWNRPSASIRAHDGHGAIASVHMRPTKTNDFTEHHANAHLIAAAPEMKKQLQRALTIIEAEPKLRKHYKPGWIKTTRELLEKLSEEAES